VVDSGRPFGKTDGLPTATAIATRYWAGHLGCSENELFSQPLRIVTHGKDLADYDGVFALFRGCAAVVSVPPEREVAIRRQLAARSDQISPLLLATMLSDIADRIIGPAFIGYAPTVPPPMHSVRELGPDDLEARHTLQKACTPQEWEHGGGADADPSSGVFVDGHLAALASYEVWGGAIAHISIVTHPGHRHHGYGRSAVARIAHRALACGLLPQYRTLESNAPSMKIARALGFQTFARSIAIRLRSQAR
jgi:GNAT superfamily N-acetyltransferase